MQYWIEWPRYMLQVKITFRLNQILLKTELLDNAIPEL